MHKIHEIKSIDFTKREIILIVNKKTYHLPLSEVLELSKKKMSKEEIDIKNLDHLA